MADDDWQSIIGFGGKPFMIDYPWHFLCEIEADWTRLRIKAKGEWNCLGDHYVSCGPRGYPGLAFGADRLLVPDAAPGALIGKFGGSLAHRTDGTVFAIGDQCIIAVPEKKPTTFAIAINGALPRVVSELDELTLELFGIADPN